MFPEMWEVIDGLGRGGWPGPSIPACRSLVLSTAQYLPSGTFFFMFVFPLLGPDVFQRQPFCSGNESDSSKNRARLSCKVVLVQSSLNSKD